MPNAWQKKAHVPAGTGFAAKPAIARGMIERAIAAGVPFGWVAADSVYGVSDIETTLRRAGKGYVLGVNANHLFHSGAKPRPGRRLRQRDRARKALTGPHGNVCPLAMAAKALRLYGWAYLELADLDAAQYNSSLAGLWTRGLLIRRTIAPFAPFDPFDRLRMRAQDEGGYGLFLHLVSTRNSHRNPGQGRGPSLGDRGRFQDHQKRTRTRP